MEPLSITATCIGLASTITSTSLVVIGFVKDVRAARSDLDAVSRELLSLKTVLELLAEDVNDSTNQSIPQTLQKQIAGIVTNCTGVVLNIEQTLKKHEGGKLNKAAKWVASGKSDVAKLQSSLEAHKSALEIALDMVTLTLAREIKADTQEILGDTSAIKEDTAQILAEIARLQEQLPRDANKRGAAFMLERYLDNLTSYAETVCDPYLDDSDGSRPISQPGSSGENSWSNDSPPPTVHEYQERASAGPPISTTISSSATSSQAEPNQTLKLDDEHIVREAIGTGNIIQSTPATAAGLQGHENLRGPAAVEVATDVDSPASSVNITGDAPGGIRRRRVRREEAREANVAEKPDPLSDVSELSTERVDNAEHVKPISSKGLFSVATISTKPVHLIRADIIRVLKQLGVEYTEIGGGIFFFFGFSCRHTPSFNLKNLKKVVDLPLSSHGNQTPGQRRRINFGGFMNGGNSNSLDRDREDFRKAKKSPQTPRTPGRNQNLGGADNSYTNSDASDESDNSNHRGSSARMVGETSTHIQSELGGSMILEFEIFIVKVPPMSLHGIRFKRLAGWTWQYKNMVDRILRELSFKLEI